jgi:RHS repeat-associated protein
MTHGYNTAGDESSVSYSDSTPGVTFSYGRRGRKSTAAWNSITATMTRNDADQQLTENYSGGILDGLSMNGTFDANLRRTTVEAKQGTTSLQSAGYAFDYAGRLGTVTDNSASSYTANYAYHANSMLVSNIAFKQSTSVRLSTTKSYDLLNRLTSISSVASGTGAPKLPISFAYDYNTANQRIRCALEDGSYWIYMYDPLGQVTSGKRYWADGTPVDGQQFEYSFDDIGNRITTGGRASAASTYTRTATNAYTQRTVAGAIDVLGVANPTASVTVNGSTANRRGDYFHYPLSIANSSPAYPTVTVASTYGGGASSSGKVFVPASTETFTHDQDGNLTADGRWAYTWDAENRLIQMIRDTDSPSGAREKLVFTYDWMGRRIRKQFYTYSSGWVLQSDTIFLYDQWNLICEFDASSSQPGTLVRSYIWGTDLSGSMQSLGGVGGLLKVTDAPLGSTTHNFVAYDGNGNVAALIDGGTGAMNARYEYGPFAEPLRTVGTMAKKTPLRFSTKYTDNESGLVYYGYRYYNPSTGRWLSRDPIGERGGRGLYNFIRNECLTRIDRLGLIRFPYPDPDRSKGDASVANIDFTLEANDLCKFTGNPSITITITVEWPGLLNFNQVVPTVGEVEISGQIIPFPTPPPGAPGSSSSTITYRIPQPSCPGARQSGAGTIEIIDRTRQRLGVSGVAQIYGYTWSYSCLSRGAGLGAIGACGCTILDPFTYNVRLEVSSTTWPDLE